MIVAAALGTLGGANVAARRVGAAPAQPSATSQSSSTSSSVPSYGDGSLAGWTPGSSSPIGPPTLPSRSLTPTPGGVPPAGVLAPQLASDGIPAVALDAYRKAAAAVALTYPGCGLPWPLLAAIGRVESDHGRFGGSQLYSDGTSAPRVIGIPLNGHGTALIWDTDHGVLDGDTVYDHAVGPMQFIPSTWAHWGVDANHDGKISPFNIYDAAQAAADYLCAAGGNLATAQGQIRAVLAYNDSAEYLATVLALEKIYASGAPGVTIPILPANPMPPPHEAPLPPPANPGPPLALTATIAAAKAGKGAATTRGGSVAGSGSGSGTGAQSGTGAGTTPGSSTAPGTPPPAGSGSTTPPAGGGTTTAPPPPPTTPPPPAPTTAALNVTLTPTATAPLNVTADAAGSTPADGTTIVSYTFNFGEGDPVVVTPDAGTKADHAYTTAGPHTVTLTVTDSAGGTATKTFDITVTAPSTDASSGSTTNGTDATGTTGAGTGGTPAADPGSASGSAAAPSSP